MYGMVPAPMTKFQFISFGSQSERQNLMPHADTKNRLPSEQVAHGLNSGFYIRGIARPVRKKNSVGIPILNLARVSETRKNFNFFAHGKQTVRNISLCSKI